METLFTLTVAGAFCILNLLAYVFRRGQLDLTPTLMVIQMTAWSAYTILDFPKAYPLNYTYFLVKINLVLSVAAFLYWDYALRKTLRRAIDAKMQHIFGLLMVALAFGQVILAVVTEDNKDVFARFYDIVPLRLNLAIYGIQRCLTYHLEGEVQKEQKVQKAAAS